MTVKVPNFHGREACRGHAALFAKTGKSKDPARRAICDTCPVIPECLAHALDHEAHGYWAGLSAAERTRVRSHYAIRVPS